MNKITEPGFRLPEIFAQRFDDILPNSANRPFVVSGIVKGESKGLDPKALSPAID